MAERAMAERAMAELLVIVPADRSAGYRLAGARTLPAETGPDAARHVRAALDRHDGGEPGGVLAIDHELWLQVPVAVRRDWQLRSVPLVVPLPAEGEAGGRARQDALRDLLARAVGYEITFATEE
jgi:vacuolar-type H+-ATPase subunit F/Vma7